MIPLQKAVELSHGKNSRFLSELAKTYSLTGQFAEAVRSAQQALDVAEQAHDEESARNLREALENYERDGAKAEPR